MRSQEREFWHLWKVTEVVPGQKIAYHWDYDGYPGHSWVTWELTPTKAGTQRTLTHSGVETFPGDVPEFSRQACQGGVD